MADQDAKPEEREIPGAREGEHVPPAFGSPAFHCPHCAVLARQMWVQLRRTNPGGGTSRARIWLSTCTNQACRADTCWVEELDGGRIVEPVFGGGPRPHVDMPPDVKLDYEEARRIVNLSPRGACALLRVACEKLAEDLQPEGRDLNDRIGKLVQNGLPVMVQQAMDTLRVIGSQAVHPGVIDLRDDVDTATALFELLNVVVEDRITRPQRIAEMYAKLPGQKLQGIANRDQPQAGRTADPS